MEVVATGPHHETLKQAAQYKHYDLRRAKGKFPRYHLTVYDADTAILTKSKVEADYGAAVMWAINEFIGVISRDNDA